MSTRASTSSAWRFLPTTRRPAERATRRRASNETFGRRDDSRSVLLRLEDVFRNPDGGLLAERADIPGELRVRGLVGKLPLTLVAIGLRNALGRAGLHAR